MAVSFTFAHLCSHWPEDKGHVVGAFLGPQLLPGRDLGAPVTQTAPAPILDVLNIEAFGIPPRTKHRSQPKATDQHIGQLSTHTMVRLPGRGTVEEMAGPSPLPSSTASSPHG